MTEIDRIIDTLAGELFRQSRQQSDAPDAPLVWDSSGPDFVAVEGKINLRRLAQAVLAES